MSHDFVQLLGDCSDRIRRTQPATSTGRIVRVTGPLVESVGPKASIGEVCYIERPDGELETAEVVGFQNDHLLLMTYGFSEGLAPGARVRGGQTELLIPEGLGLLGRVVDALGRPIDDEGPLRNTRNVSVRPQTPSPMSRRRIETQLGTGIRVIDGLLNIGRGQRMGIFAGSGVGKSVLLGEIARQTQADVIVVALVGERGREVREFIERDLGPEGRQRSVVVVSTADEPPLRRVAAAFSATRMAESFRDRGMDVLLLMDSLTRVALAQREIGLTRGEPPTTRGFTPSVFTLLPRLLERAGQSSRGSVTGLYTVLVEGDDLSDPVADSARSVLDGHIVLSRKLANRNHYPAVDVLASISRLAPQICDPAVREAQGRVRNWLAAYEDIEDLIQLGAYVPGGNPTADEALQRMAEIDAFRLQQIGESGSLEETLNRLQQVAGVNGESHEEVPLSAAGARTTPGNAGQGSRAGARGLGLAGSQDSGGPLTAARTVGSLESGTSRLGSAGTAQLGRG